MSFVRFARVGFTYPGAALPVLSDVELELGPGWTAVAGPNGAGKSTLLRLVAGELSPTAGAVHRGDARVAFARQSNEAPTPEVWAFAGEWDGLARRLRARWRLDVDALERWPTLSPGERQRWIVASALRAEPRVLLLDEPTNHLDADARDELLEMVREHTDVGVIVAHDRAFLDALVERTVWVEHGQATLHPGSYTEVRERLRGEAATRARERRSKKRELRRLDRELDQRRRRREAAGRNISAKRRMKWAGDSDGREVGRKVRAANAERQHAKAQSRMARRVDAQRDGLADAQVERSLGGELFVDWVPAPKSTLVRATLPDLPIGDRVLRGRALQVQRDTRLHLAGPNGAGKTTLLRAILDRWPHDPSRLLYLPQELDRAARREAVERVRSLEPEARGRALTLVAALGVDPKRLLETRDPSPGEARKVRLADGLARRVWCVALDEPTNHLDAPSIERLEAALAAYPGALLLVTHDAALARATTDERWAVAAGPKAGRPHP